MLPTWSASALNVNAEPAVHARFANSQIRDIECADECRIRMGDDLVDADLERKVPIVSTLSGSPFSCFTPVRIMNNLSRD